MRNIFDGLMLAVLLAYSNLSVYVKI